MTLHRSNWISIFTKLGAIGAGIAVGLGGNIIEGVGIVLAAFTGQMKGN